ncbi:hypothetical protein, conserved [Eimeria acervulina]|uniref:Uncharacterized protein n=1 Tax=Eimeria acervulina TaxID=5801 RepID=U6GCZ9_EIMAC|nr:hypothetical protein, conserved [Eimeria acervulina]CDI77208.1 hypothetical protein, conserved [Eimeria acervulina]
MGHTVESNPSSPGLERPILRPSSRRPGSSVDASGPSPLGKMAQPKSLRSQRMKRLDEARGDRLGAQRMRTSPASPRRDEKRDAFVDSKGHHSPSRGLSSKNTPRGKSHREPAAAKGAKKAAGSPRNDPQTPRESQQTPNDASVSPSEKSAISPSTETSAQDLRPSCAPQGSSGAESSQQAPLRCSDLTPAEMPETALQKQNSELMRQNVLLRQALLEHISKEELLFLLAYNTPSVPTRDAGDARFLQGLAPNPEDSKASDAPSTGPEKDEGDEHKHSSRARHIDLPCVRDFFTAISCCPGPSNDEPLPASEGTVAVAVAAAAESSCPLESLTTREPDTIKKEADESSPIAVDFDPFGLQKDQTETQIPPVEAESQRSTVSSSTTSTNLYRRSLEGGSLAPLSTLGVGGPPIHPTSSLGSLKPAPSRVRPRAARGSMFYPSSYRLNTVLPQAFPL